MELLYFIFNAYVVCAIASPLRSLALDNGDSIYHRKNAHDQTEIFRDKRQFNFARPVLPASSENIGSFDEYFNQETSTKPTPSIYFQQPPLDIQSSAGFSYTPTRNFNTDATNNIFISNANQQLSQLQQYTRPFVRNNFPLFHERAFDQYEYQNQFLARQNTNRNGVATKDYDQSPRQNDFKSHFPSSFIWNQAPAAKAIPAQDSVNRQFPRNRQISFTDQVQPIHFSNENSLQNFVSNKFQGEFSPLMQPSNVETLSFPITSSRAFEQDNPVQAALIYYDTSNHNRQTLNSDSQGGSMNIRQIVPSPQEFLNSALSIGSNIIEKVPGYKLTANTVGLLANITRYRPTFFGSNPLPALGQLSNRPNPLFPYANRPSSSLVLNRPQPTATIYYTTTPISTQIETTNNPTLGTNHVLIPNKPIVAAHDPSSYENSGLPTSSTQTHRDSHESSSAQNHRDSHESSSAQNHRDSHESSSSSQQYGSHENQFSSSQESSASTNKLTNGNRIQPQRHQGGSHASTSEEESSSPTDYNRPAVASDVLPDEDYGITDDDDKIDSKAIKSVLG